MNLQTIDFQFISCELPTHWNIWRESREAYDLSLYLSKQSAWCGRIEIATRRYSKKQELTRTNKKLFEHLVGFAQAVVDQWGKKAPVTPRKVENSENEKIKIVTATFTTHDNVAKIGGLMRIWQINKGRSFVFISYKSEDWYESRQVRQQEMKEREAIVASIRFRK